jgi:hypothetical protein
LSSLPVAPPRRPDRLFPSCPAALCCCLCFCSCLSFVLLVTIWIVSTNSSRSFATAAEASQGTLDES